MGYILLVLPTSIWRVFLFSEIFSILEENAKKNTGCCRNPDGNISSQGAGICAGCLFHHCCHLISLPQIAHLRNSSFISLFQLMRNVICIFSSVQSLSRVRLFATPWIAARQASLSITKSRRFTHTHVHQVGDAIQPSHPLSSPFPPAPNPSQHQSLFQWVNSSHEVAKVLEFQL